MLDLSEGKCYTALLLLDAFIVVDSVHDSVTLMCIRIALYFQHPCNWRILTASVELHNYAVT